MIASFTVNTKELEAYIERTVVNVRRTATKFVRKEAEEILAESLEEVPKDTGTLAESAYIEQQSDGSYSVGYGRGGMNPKTHAPAKEYMVKIHEDLSLSHPHGGKAKFLEDPVNRHAAVLEKKAAKAMKDAMRR